MLPCVSRGPRPGPVLAAGVFGLIALAVVVGGPAAANGGRQPGGPKLIIAVVATKTTDAAAVAAANDRFKKLNDPAGADPELKKLQDAEKALADVRQPPGYPNDPQTDNAPTVADSAAAAALAPAGLGEGLVSELARKRAADKPAKDQYRWVKVRGNRELRILGLDDPKVGYFKEATDAPNTVFVHPRFDFLMSHRAAPAGQIPDFFMLVQEPAELRITDADMTGVARPSGGQPRVELFLNKLGNDKLGELTKTPGRYLALSDSTGVIEIIKVTEPVANGRLVLGSRLSPTELGEMLKRLEAALVR